MKTAIRQKQLWALPRARGWKSPNLETIVTEKGEYLGARKTIAGQPTTVLLPEILTNFLLAIPFKKSMRWSDYDLRFARPIHWLLALYDGNVVPLKIEDIASGNTSCGHRFMSPAPFAVSNFEDYLNKTRQNYVIADPAERKKLILAEAQKAAAEVGGKIFYTEDLLDTVSFYCGISGNRPRQLRQRLFKNSQRSSHHHNDLPPEILPRY